MSRCGGRRPQLLSPGLDLLADVAMTDVAMTDVAITGYAHAVMPDTSNIGYAGVLSTKEHGKSGSAELAGDGDAANGDSANGDAVDGDAADADVRGKQADRAAVLKIIKSNAGKCVDSEGNNFSQRFSGRGGRAAAPKNADADRVRINLDFLDLNLPQNQLLSIVSMPWELDFARFGRNSGGNGASGSHGSSANYGESNASKMSSVGERQSVRSATPPLIHPQQDNIYRESKLEADLSEKMQELDKCEKDIYTLQQKREEDLKKLQQTFQEECKKKQDEQQKLRHEVQSIVKELQEQNKKCKRNVEELRNENATLKKNSGEFKQLQRNNEILQHSIGELQSELEKSKKQKREIDESLTLYKQKDQENDNRIKQLRQENQKMQERQKSVCEVMKEQMLALSPNP